MERFTSLAKAHGTPLLIFSPQAIIRQYRKLQTALPQVKHHYALKALPYEGCVQAITSCGGYFDVASIGEMEIIKQNAPEKLSASIYTHPIKTKQDIESALEYGIQTMVADNMEELIKLLPYKSSVKLLIRISFPNPEARCDLSSKFGASLEQGRQLISFCLQQGIQLAGCSFHAGSQLPGPEAMLFAISQIKQLYNWCASELNYTMAVLNIGGGFPAKLSHSIPDLSTFCAPIHDLLNELFPDTEIWSEPGRCLATDCMTHISSVIGKSIRHGKKWYYLDDGVYGTFSGKIYDHAEYQHQPLEAQTDTALAPSVLAGPTCDSIDVLKEMVLLPELKVGDLIITPQIGAYGWASRTQFNHLKSAAIIESDLLEMKEFASSSLRWTSLAGNPSFKSSPELELELSQITAN